MKKPQPKNIVNLQRVPGVRGPGTKKTYVGTVGDPFSIEVVVFGSPPDSWFIHGIRGFGVSFVGSRAHTLTEDTIAQLNESVKALEEDR